MALDPRFIVTSDLEEYFVDKDTGLPLAGGIVTFYSDLNRTTKKPVYQLTGAPPNYNYAVLQDPVVLSDVGTFQDSLGNNIVPYYYPFEGTPDDNTGVLELYYITVDNSGGVRQFTRQGWPNFSSEDIPGSNGLDITNYIPNGQFLAHNEIISATEPPVVSIGGVDAQEIAQGGWYFKRSTGGSSTFSNSFSRITTGIAGLNDFPRYAFNFQCTSFNANDQVHDLAIQWPDVNKFSGGDPVGEQTYTFFFAAESRDSNTYIFDVRLIQNYGTGGTPSTQTDVSIGTVAISPGYSYYTVTVPAFPANAGTLGTNNDDFVSLALRGPSNAWSIQATDFVLVIGSVALTSFPVQTNADMLTRGVAGWMPTPAENGNDLYLPLVLTPSGMTFDHSQIGKIYANTDDTLSIGELACDGSSYLASAYSSDGIPYSRLQTKLFITAERGNRFGTGTGFANMYTLSGSSDYLLLVNNSVGLQTNPSDGAVPTNFDFVHNGIAAVFPGTTSIGIKAYTNSNHIVTAIATTAGAVGAAAAAGTSGFTVSSLTDFQATTGFYAFLVTPVAAAGLAGLYFTFQTTSTSYYMWFKVDGAGADPAPGGTGIQVNLIGTMSALDVSKVLAGALSSFQVNAIRTKAAGTFAAGAYFNFFAANAARVAWYKLDGAGTQPVVGLVTYIEVDVITGDTATNVAFRTQVAVNSTYVGVPDLRGIFLRGTDTLGLHDADGANRFGLYDELVPSLTGSYEYDAFRSHKHSIAITADGVTDSTVGSGGGAAKAAANTGLTGGSETRPINMFVNYIIKY